MVLLMALGSAVPSGVLLYGSLLPHDLALLTWMALVPLLVALRFVPYWQAFSLSWLTGVVVYGLHCSWLLGSATHP